TTEAFSQILAESRTLRERRGHALAEHRASIDRGDETIQRESGLGLEGGQGTDGNLAATLERTEKASFGADAGGRGRMMKGLQQLARFDVVVSRYDRQSPLPHRGQPHQRLEELRDPRPP